MLAVPKLQKEIWGLENGNVGLYPPMLSTVAINGGIVLGAFDDDTGEMIGFLFGFLGREPGGPLKLCSQTMGVGEKWRGLGIAEALKRTQRERVLKQDLPLITWTYDPLEGPNAYLNLHKLRAVSRTYWRDIYGEHFGRLNAGLPTDRLLAEWWIGGERLDQPAHEDQARQSEAAAIFEVKGCGLERWVTTMRLDLDAPALLLDTVADLQAVKAINLELAHDWRLKVREAFENYFAKNYIAVDFISTIVDGERRNRYLLRRATPDLMATIGSIR
jgi:predicted GNAT superfamily acetyltransferase